MSAEGSTPIVIIGGGPAGTTLAILLAEASIPVVLVEDGKRPDLVVGESLIPAVVPLLRKLGIEDEVKAISQHKPGVSFLHEKAAPIHFNFSPVARYLPTYAYNVPRPQFDELLRTRAEQAGVNFIRHRAKLTAHPGNPERELALSDESLAAIPQLGGRQPRLIVDATGRGRLSARLLAIDAHHGPRKDVAHFAHFTDCPRPTPEGQVVINSLSEGWAWVIPLPDRVSIGIVVNKETARRWGETPAQRLQYALDNEALLQTAVPNAKRISPTATYNNYQLTSKRGHGPGWVATGDAFGFVDPMLSSGLFLAMHSSHLLFDRALSRPEHHWQPGINRYLDEFSQWLHCWKELIQYFYDGRIFALHEAGTQTAARIPIPSPFSLLEKHTSKHIACMASGALTTKRYSRSILSFASKHLVWGVPKPQHFAIH